MTTMSSTSFLYFLNKLRNMSLQIMDNFLRFCIITWKVIVIATLLWRNQTPRHPCNHKACDITWNYCHLTPPVRAVPSNSVTVNNISRTHEYHARPRQSNNFSHLTPSALSTPLFQFHPSLVPHRETCNDKLMLRARTPPLDISMHF